MWPATKMISVPDCSWWKRIAQGVAPWASEELTVRLLCISHQIVVIRLLAATFW
jgi:hypothetical protein